MKERFNLTEWAIRERSLVWYFMIAFRVAGNLGVPETRP